MSFVSYLVTPNGKKIVEKVEKTHAHGVQMRGIAEHVHGCQLVETLMPLCSQYGLCLELYDGEDFTPINSVEDMLVHMNACDVERLCVCDGETERTDDNDTTFLSVLLVYGNCADDPEIGRGEMIADWGGCSDWYEIFSPVIDDFINDYYIKKKAEEVVQAGDDPQFGQCGKCGDYVTFPCYNCIAREMEKGN